MPKLSCMPSLKKLRARKKKQCASNQIEDEDASKAEIQNVVSSMLLDLSNGDQMAQEEHVFWQTLLSTLLGPDVNTGLEKEELAEGLRKLRNRTLGGVLLINAIWLSVLSYFYIGIDSPLSRLNIYGIISGALYGFTLVIQIVGLTASRTEQVLRRLARAVYGAEVPTYVHERERRD